jgi:hypothetical protein
MLVAHAEPVMLANETVDWRVRAVRQETGSSVKINLVFIGQIRSVQEECHWALDRPMYGHWTIGHTTPQALFFIFYF